jgi:hypothetical protein
MAGPTPSTFLLAAFVQLNSGKGVRFIIRRSESNKPDTFSHELLLESANDRHVGRFHVADYNDPLVTLIEDYSQVFAIRRQFNIANVWLLQEVFDRKRRLRSECRGDGNNKK